MAKRLREVEYYRLWSGNAGDSGTWDTDFISIPADTPEHRLEAAVKTAAAKIKWRDEPPVLVGLYSAPEPEEEDDEPSRALEVTFSVSGYYLQHVEITDKRYMAKSPQQLAMLFEEGKLATTIHEDGDFAISEVRTGKIIGRIVSQKDNTSYEDFTVGDPPHGQSPA